MNQEMYVESRSWKRQGNGVSLTASRKEYSSAHTLILAQSHTDLFQIPEL